MIIIYTGVTGSIVVCVSPLVSLMMDQKSSFVLKGIKTEFVGEAQIEKDVIHKVLDGEVPIVNYMQQFV